jgi:hypothetical protein
MNYWLKKYPLMDENRGDEDLGGGGGDGDDKTIDRGDDVTDTGDDPEVDPEKEPEVDPEQEPEAKKDSPDRDEKGRFIPKERFDEAVGKERKAREEAEKRLAEIAEANARAENQEGVEKIQAKIDELDEELEKLSTEGTPEQRKAVRAQIREQERMLADIKATARANFAQAQAVEQVRYDAAVSQLERDYPFLNVDDKEAFNPDMAQTVAELKGAFEAAGMSSTQALAKARDTLKLALDSMLGSSKPGGKPDPEKEAAAAAKEAKRKADAIAAGAAAKGKQPPSAADGSKGGKADIKAPKEIAKMSDAEFDKLSEEDLKRARGDMG